MKIRKFEILDVIDSPGGSGPERAFKIKYKGIVNKEWKESELWVIAKNKDDAKEQAMKRFAGKE